MAGNTEAETATEAAETLPMATGSFFKRKTAGKNMRRRPRDEETDEEGKQDEESARLAKVARNGGPALGPARPNSGGGEPGDAGVGFSYASSRTVQVADDGGATRVNESETGFDRDARALRERQLKQAAAAIAGEKAPEDDKLYRGINSYTDHRAGFRREHTVASEKGGGAHGPLRASQHIRWSVRFDYQPDICKDYKETGTCGYGDACKFMHDRGDYKAGWQIDREWDEKEKQKKALAAARAAGGDVSDDDGAPEEDSDDEALPFACFICRRPFVDPVVTRCGHYFCEHCALKHNSQSKNCFVCEKPTGGVFNTAHEIVKRMKEEKGAEGAGKPKTKRRGAGRAVVDPEDEDAPTVV